MRKNFTKQCDEGTIKRNYLFRYALYLSLLFLLQHIPENVFAQTKTITGLVVDDQNEPLPGVTVSVKGTKTTSPTNTNGKFSIRVLNSQSILVFSYIGFSSTEVIVSDKTVINVTMKSNSTTLNEVVATGYGSQRKTDITGTIGVVNMADLQKAPVTSFDLALAGRVAGVQVTAADGQPGDPSDIVIRGPGSVNNSNAPLYVIDDFPIESFNASNLNPAEIESISVLKGASATAIYGSRGAQGVIIINTKRGKLGEPVVAYTGYAGFNNITKKVPLLNAYEFVKLQLEIDPTTATSDYLSGGKTLESYRGVKGVDFQDVLYDNGFFQNHTASISGGTAATKYVISGSATDQGGIIKNSGLVRYQGRITLDQQISKVFKVGANMNYTSLLASGTRPRSQNTGTGNDVGFNLLGNIWRYRPITGSLVEEELSDEFLDANQVPGVSNRVNPYISTINEIDNRGEKTFLANMFAEINISNAIKYRVNGGLVLSTVETKQFYNSLTRQGSPLTGQGISLGINGNMGTAITNDYSNEHILTFTKKFNKNHLLTANAIASFQIHNTHSFNARALKLPNETIGLDGLLDYASTLTSARSQFAQIGYAARANYAMYGGKYLFTGTYRIDGSSKFAEGQRFGYFPSGAFAWRLSDENFIRKLKVFSNAKLRVEYGLTGNNRVGDFAYLDQINNAGAIGISNGYYTFNNVLVDVFKRAVLGNPAIKWETTHALDLGLELGFFHDRLSIEATYYKKNVTDLLLNSTLASSAGYTTILANVGETSNRGFEFTLNSENISSDNFNWSTNFNIAFNRNKIEKLANGSDNILTKVGGTGGGQFDTYPGYIAKVGYPISSMYGYVSDGVYQLSDFDLLPNGAYQLKDNVPLNASADLNQSRLVSNGAAVKPGDPKFKDINGDGIITVDDKTIIGNPNPNFIGGLSNNFRYKAFDLNVFLQFSYGNDTFNANRLFFEGRTSYGNNQFATYANRWSLTNQDTDIPRAGATGGTAQVYSSRFVEDASFLRLKTVQLGYKIPGSLTKRAGIKSVRIYASAQNILTWTKYSSTDPENYTRGTGLTAGFDYSAYPRAFTTTVGLNISL